MKKKKGYLRNVVNEAYVHKPLQFAYEWEVEVEQNGGGSHQIVTITANDLKKVDLTTVKADDVFINFGGKIISIDGQS